MSTPLISPNDQQIDNKFRQVNEIFKKIFNPEYYSSKNGVQQIKDVGGISSIMSLLDISHRQGLSSHADNTKRIQVFGLNQSPKGQNILKKYLSAQRDFTINILLYIITLRFFIKILFMRDGIPTDSILDEIISFLLLNVMIFLKALVNLQFLKMDQTQKRYHDEEWVKVKRDGEIVQTKEKYLMVGDVILIGAEDHVRVDGIVLSSQELTVSQAQTMLRQDVKKKNSILNWRENEYNQAFDPFILAGTTILYGKAELLVCRIGQQCTFRVVNQKLQQFSAQTTPLIYNLKKVLSFVQRSSNLIAFCASTYFAFYNLQIAIAQQTVSWFTFLQILKTYSSFVGFVCLLQKLKIVRSLQFYLQSYKSDKCFRIKNKCTLQKLNNVDLFIIEKQALKIIDSERGYIIPKLNFITFLNKNFNIKIVTSQAKENIVEQFQLYDYDNETLIMGEQSFYQDGPEYQNQNNSNKINRLKSSLFITKCNRKKLQTQIIPIFEGLQYKIAYIYKFKPFQDNNKTSPNIISICFSQQFSQSTTLHRQGNLQQWIRIKNTTIAQDHIKQIIDKSIIFCQLYNVYMIQFLNNIIIFIFLSWISIHRDYSIDFYYSLMIIIIARFIFFRLYRSIALNRQVPQQRETISYRKIVYINVFLFFYYMYVVVNLQKEINVVLFFMCNSLLRTEILLYKVNRMVETLKHIFRHNLIVFVMLGGFLVGRIFYKHEISEQILLAKYVLGLSFLLIVYGVFG